METRETSSAQQPAASAASSGWVDALEGVNGRLGFEVDGRTVAILQSDGERIELMHDEAPVEARAIWKSEDDIKKVLSGELNVVVAALQGRLALDGDAMFAIKVLFGLRAAPPLAADSKKGG